MSNYVVSVENKKQLTNGLSEFVVKRYEIPAFALCPRCKVFMRYYPDARTYAHEERKPCDFSMTVEQYIDGQLSKLENA